MMTITKAPTLSGYAEVHAKWLSYHVAASYLRDHGRTLPFDSPPWRIIEAHARQAEAKADAMLPLLRVLR